MQDTETLRRLAIGSYSPTEVQRLAGVPVTLTRRFLSKYKSELGLWGGVLSHDQHLDGRWYATFQDLLELRCLQAFHDAGVSWRRIKRTAEYSRDRFDTDYPFSHRRFLTEGKSIFAHTEEGLEQLSSRGQFTFEEIIGPELYDPVEFNNSGLPVKWYPAVEWGWEDNSRAVVVDPLRSFGSPVVDDCGVPTEVLYDSYKAEGHNVCRVARIYEVPINSVQTAVDFEKYLAIRGSSKRQ